MTQAPRSAEEIDWYARSSELECGMVFKTHNGLIKLDWPVPGDGTKWFVQTEGQRSWASYNDTIEPCDLIGSPIADPFSS